MCRGNDGSTRSVTALNYDSKKPDNRDDAGFPYELED